MARRRTSLNEFNDDEQLMMSPLRRTPMAPPTPTRSVQAPPMQAPAASPSSARPPSAMSMTPSGSPQGPIDFRQPREQAPGVPAVGVPGGGEQFAFDPSIMPTTGAPTGPPVQAYGGGFQPSGNPLADIKSFGATDNESFLAMLNALKAAYPGRISDVGASATGVWDKIVVDGQIYDAIKGATGTSGEPMLMREQPGGGAFGGGMGFGGTTMGLGGVPSAGQGQTTMPLGRPTRTREAVAQQAVAPAAGLPAYDWLLQQQEQANRDADEQDFLMRSQSQRRFRVR